MLRRWLQRRPARAVPWQAFVTALARGRASEVRQELAVLLAAPAAPPLARCLDAARKAGFSARECEKLAAYGEFALGQGAQAFARVLGQDLAADDLTLAIATLAQAYRAQRYDEACRLLTTLDGARFAGAPELPLFYIQAIQHTLAASGDVAAALAVYREACRLVAAERLFLVAYPLCFEAGWLDEADRLNRLLPPAQREPEERFAAGFVELARDYYPEGFRLYEARLEMEEARAGLDADLLALPRWQGERCAGPLLLYAEQGLGDLIMMARYLPWADGSSRELALIVPPAAQALLAHNFPAHAIHTAPPKNFAGPAAGMMSLPHLYKTTPTHVPALEGYLEAPPENRHYWQKRLAALSRPGAVRVGLAWSGFPGHRADRRRSLPFALLLSWLRQWPQVDFYALQTLQAPVCLDNLIEVGEELLTLADTAAIVDEIDLVLSVDTSLVHLAGALGKACWLMLPHRYEWRWGLSGEQNAWYRSVRVWRQATHGDWAGLLQRLGAEFAAWLAGRGPA